MSTTEATMSNRVRNAPAGRLEKSCGECWRRRTATQSVRRKADARRCLDMDGICTGTSRPPTRDATILRPGGLVPQRVGGLFGGFLAPTERRDRIQLFDGEGLGAVFVYEFQHLAAAAGHAGQRVVGDEYR